MNKLFKSLSVMLAVVAMAATMTACGGAKEETAPAEGTEEAAAEATEAKYTAGTYSAEADGFGGALKVDVTVDENAITAVEVTENAETDGIGSVAVEQLPATIVEAQGVEVEAVAGCTVSSNAIIEAVTAALDEAVVK